MHSKRVCRAFGRLACLTLVLLATFVLVARAQDADNQRLVGLDRQIERLEAEVADGRIDGAEIERLRERLLGLRSEVLAIEAAASTPLADATERLERLGPSPEEGIEEPPELRDRRAALGQEVARAQVPVIEARETLDRIDVLLRNIDREAWQRLTEELTTLGPSPMRPQTWRMAQSSLGEAISAGLATLRAGYADTDRRAELGRRLALNLILLVVGVAVTFSFRRWLTSVVERALSRVTSARSVAWLIVMRNASRLIVPIVGLGLLFALLDPDRLSEGTDRFVLFNLPNFVLTLIGASWLGNSLFSPGLAHYRLVSVEQVDAVRGARLVWGLGVVLALHFAIDGASRSFDLGPASLAALYFPVIVFGGLGLSRVAPLLDAIRQTIAAREADLPVEQRSAAIGLRLVGFLRRVLLAVTIAAPLLAAVGYLSAARDLMFPTILTLGVIGAGIVLFDLLYKTMRSVVPAQPGEQEGLGPVLIVTLLLIPAVPIFALIWGARRSDLDVGWSMLRDGVSLGGIRVSLGDLVTFALVFGLIYALTRMLKSLLRSSVLPRTRMDAGGRNAVLAGVGYLGFFIAALAAVSSTGIDLSSIAIVAGALSVGIGFGLQTVVSNFVSGIILLVERPIKEGDWIEVSGHSGYVTDISVRSTVIETFDRASVIVPNSDLVAGTVLNWTHSGMSGRLRVPISVGYDSDARQVEKILLEVARMHPAVMERPEPIVLFMGFGTDALDFEIRCWLRDVNFTLTARSDMNFEILARFRAAGIDIPFPQRDVQIRGLDSLSRAIAGGRDPGETA